ncbi:MAG: VCBS repeat-containing protein [Leptospiraceae bacterium]|nr:VCBS repeat-containing protein [Leptospiraceae bacterium]
MKRIFLTFIYILSTSLFFNCLGAGRAGTDISGADPKSIIDSLILSQLFRASSDTTLPTLDSQNIISNMHLEVGKIIGTSSDNVAVAGVYVQINSGGYNIAEGTTSFSYTIPATTKLLGTGNTIAIKVIDTSGNEKITNFTGIKKGENKDVNGDGYPDLIVSAPRYNTDGKVYIFHGGTSGISSTNTTSANAIITPPSVPAGYTNTYNFGNKFATGDINGDGFADLIICTLGAGDQFNVDGVFLYLGSSSGILTTPSWKKYDGDGATNHFCKSLTIADFNNDGYEDIAVSDSNAKTISIFNGNSSGSLSNTADSIIISDVTNFGTFIQAGDINSDGNIDLVITDTSYLYYTKNPGSGFPSSTTISASTQIQVSANVSTVTGLQLGDVNGDGYLDAILIGDGNFAEVNIFKNTKTSTPFNTSNKNQINQFTLSGSSYSSLITCKDYNLDGYDDIIVGDPKFAVSGLTNGKIYFFNGKSSWTDLASSSADLQITSSSDRAEFGSGISLLDINGDNLPDLVTAETGPNPGKVVIYNNTDKSFNSLVYGSPNFSISGESGSTGKFGLFISR